MKPLTCPVCGEETKIDCTRGDCELIARRRKCKTCGYKFYTLEQEDPEAKALFVKYDYQFRNYKEWRMQ